MSAPAISSLKDFLACATPQQIKATLDSLDAEQCVEILHDWRTWARSEQVAPPGDWQTWIFRAGRGAGKTRAGAEWIRERVKAGEGRLGLIAPTASDARDVMVEGESGILAVSWEHDKTADGTLIGRPQYEPSKRRLTWQNGAIATMFSAEEPERLRGPQHGTIWADELAAWKYLRSTWDMAMLGLRVGHHPRVMVTTTPKPLAILRELERDKRTVVTTGSTFDNMANLAPGFIAAVRDRYEGTRLGRQELYAEILGEAEGALWSRDMIEGTRHRGDLPQMRRVVVAVDPATTAKDDSDETGIIAAGLGEDGRGYVMRDASGRYSPADWARRVVRLYEKVGADRIIAEGNQGGDMVRHTIATEWPAAPIKIVHASRGKQARAEPVAALYEQGKVRHVGNLGELEDQMVNWEPLSGQASPDRLDAMVWALTELMVGGVRHEFW